MVNLQPLSTSNNSNSSEQSGSPSLSPTSPLPPYIPILLPHLLYPPPSSSSFQFTPFHFQETMFSPSFFYYCYYPQYPPFFYLYPSTPSFTPPPPPYYSGSQPVAMENSVVADTHNGGVVLTPPAPAGRRAGNRKPFIQRNKRRWLRKEWRQKVEHASGSHPSPSLQPLPRPPISGHLANCTTLMVKNIPNFISRRTMIDMLDSHCRKQNNKASYDFFYLPFDFEQKKNLGYAFVNFTTEEGASTLDICWNGKGWCVSTKKIREICPAKVQGFEMCKKHFKDTGFRCSSAEFLPVEFSPPRNGLNGGACKMSTVGVWLPNKNWKLNTVNPPRLRH